MAAPRGGSARHTAEHGNAGGAQYPIREYGLPLTEESYFSVMREVIAELYETVELKPGVRTMLAKLQAEGARMCICSNTWAEQCRTVLTRLGIAQYFSFIVEARGVLHKSRPEVFFECMSRHGRCRSRRLRRVRGCRIRRRHRPQGRVLRHWHRRPHLCRRRAGDAPHLQPVRAPVGCAGLDTCVIKRAAACGSFLYLILLCSCILCARRV